MGFAVINSHATDLPPGPGDPLLATPPSLDATDAEHSSTVYERITNLPEVLGACGQSLSSKLPKNLNAYWVVLTSLAVWFLFVHSPPILIRRRAYADVPFAGHLAGAYTIYLACVFNTLFTPSTLGGQARPFHVWVGRVGFVMGYISFVLGVYIAWWPYRENRPDLGFSIGISIGGIAQVMTQIAGYRAIKRYQRAKDMIAQATVDTAKEVLDGWEKEKQSSLRSHIYNMVALFALACGIPAVMRLVGELGSGVGVAGLVLAIVGLNLIAPSYAQNFIRPIEVTI